MQYFSGAKSFVKQFINPSKSVKIQTEVLQSKSFNLEEKISDKFDSDLSAISEKIYISKIKYIGSDIEIKAAVLPLNDSTFLVANIVKDEPNSYKILSDTKNFIEYVKMESGVLYNIGLKKPKVVDKKYITFLDDDLDPNKEIDIGAQSLDTIESIQIKLGLAWQCSFSKETVELLEQYASKILGNPEKSILENVKEMINDANLKKNIENITINENQLSAEGISVTNVYKIANTIGDSGDRETPLLKEVQVDKDGVKAIYIEDVQLKDYPNENGGAILNTDDVVNKVKKVIVGINSSTLGYIKNENPSNEITDLADIFDGSNLPN